MLAERPKGKKMTVAAEPIDLEDLLPIPEGANLLHVAPSTLRQHLSLGRLTRYYVGRRVLVSRRELSHFVRVGAKGSVA